MVSTSCRRGAWLLPLALAAGAAPAVGQRPTDFSPTDRRLVAALESYIPHIIRQNGTPGLNIAVASHGRLIWERGFGLANLATRAPMTPATVMHSGSMGKTYTATAVMQLVEQGVLGLYEPINRYLKGFQIINPLGDREITVFDLLTHRSGLSGNTAGSHFAIPAPLREFIPAGYRRTHFEWYQETALPLWTHKVGEQFDYSNFGLATLGYLVEVTNPEGLSFSDYVRRHIMEPLSMTSSRFPPVQETPWIPKEIADRMSTGYAAFGPVALPTPTIYFADYPAGTVVTTPGDHIRLLMAYLNGGELDGHRILKPETVRLMLSPKVTFSVQGREPSPLTSSGVGLIWLVNNAGKPDEYFSHAGAHMFGWYNDARAYPRRSLAVVVASNAWDMVAASPAVYQRIMDFVHTWLANESVSAVRAPAPASWAWKTSYVIGLMMAERLRGYLGIPEPITDAMIETMATGAIVRAERENGEPVWDAEAFRLGMRDMRAVPMTREAIREFLASERVRVGPEEIRILYHELGGRGEFPVPIEVFF